MAVCQTRCAQGIDAVTDCGLPALGIACIRRLLDAEGELGSLQGLLFGLFKGDIDTAPLKGI